MIIKPFNLVFFAFFAVLIGMVILLWALLRKKDEKVRRAWIIGILLLDIVLFFIYKGFLSVDAEFRAIKGIDSFNWFDELPLQLCNINMFLIPAALLTKKRGLLGFCFFIAPLGALMAMLAPEPAFSGYSLWTMRILGFYVTHGLIFVCGLSLASLNFYRPRFRDLPLIVATLFAVAAVMFLVNWLLRATVCPYANYFFTWGPNGVGLLELFWSWIPLPFLYEISSLLILLPYMLLVTGGFTAAAVIGKHGKERAETAN